MRLPDFICIGAMRCGTTTLWSLLASMTDIYLPDRKELHYFDMDYEKGLEYYSTFFRDAADIQKCGEFSPDYLPIHYCRDRVKLDIPNVRLFLEIPSPEHGLIIDLVCVGALKICHLKRP